jgi:hypothetical protein
MRDASFKPQVRVTETRGERETHAERARFALYRMDAYASRVRPPPPPSPLTISLAYSPGLVDRPGRFR